MLIFVLSSLRLKYLSALRVFLSQRFSQINLLEKDVDEKAPAIICQLKQVLVYDFHLEQLMQLLLQLYLVYLKLVMFHSKLFGKHPNNFQLLLNYYHLFFHPHYVT